MKDTTLHIRVTAELKAELEAEARAQDVPVAQIVRRRLQGVVIPPEHKPRPTISGAEATGVLAGLAGAPVPSIAAKIDAGETVICIHPKARLRPVVGGKKCLDCGAVL
jgi:hypothetical protein